MFTLPVRDRTCSSGRFELHSSAANVMHLLRSIYVSRCCCTRLKEDGVAQGFTLPLTDWLQATLLTPSTTYLFGVARDRRSCAELDVQDFPSISLSSRPGRQPEFPKVRLPRSYCIIIKASSHHHRRFVASLRNAGSSAALCAHRTAAAIDNARLRNIATMI